uniref:Uncharacterized protein n=1 Tax=Parascaris univalens TaxID=6257 RepID=A0A914ZL37_PARUN
MLCFAKGAYTLITIPVHIELLNGQVLFCITRQTVATDRLYGGPIKYESRYCSSTHIIESYPFAIRFMGISPVPMDRTMCCHDRELLPSVTSFLQNRRRKATMCSQLQMH